MSYSKTPAQMLEALLPDSPAARAVRAVAKLVLDAGGRAMLVGGCVRDALRGVKSKDYDIEVYGIPADRLESLLSSRFNINKVGMSFGVFKLGAHDIDVSLPRRESKMSPGHRGFMVNTLPELSFTEACMRRDFTINAIMADPLTGEIADHCNGIADLEAGIIRHVGPQFAEDPLRVLRAMQFAARFSFPVAQETVELCSRITPENLPAERLAGEWEKLLLKGLKPSLGLEFLKTCGWIKYYPELESLIDCPQDPRWHPEGDVWTHTLHAMDALPLVRKGVHMDDLTVAVSGLCHDLGKPETTATAVDGKITSYRHERLGASHVRSFIRRLWNRPDFEESVVRLVAAHMRPVALVVNNASDKAYRKLSVDALRLDLLADVVECDMRATPPNGPDLGIIAKFRAKTEELAVSHEPPKPLLQGRHLIARGMKPGPAFGKILAECYSRQINGDFLDEESALAFLDRRLAGKIKNAAPEA